MTRNARRSRPGRIGTTLVAVVAMVSLVPIAPAPTRGDSPPDHLVISEVVTGGTSASDELIELYNPTGVPLPLEGLEVVYASASGLTVSRRVAWEAGAPELPPGRHLLLANELGAYAGIADALYASGIAATGGSVAIRIQGGASAIDAVGWGTAASTWLEGTPAPAPAAGASLERLPGGSLGSTQDTDDNAVDFVERLLPDPQNLAAPPTPDPSGPAPTPSPTATPTATPTPVPSAPMTPTPTPGTMPDATVSVATARALPDGASATIEGVALTDSTFTEGGGYVADASGGIAVLLSSGAFERGARLRITGTVDDRFAQRTLRASGSDVVSLGTGSDPASETVATGSVGEAFEGRLVRVAGTIAGAPTSLSAGLAYAVDDGSGPTRVLVGSANGVDTTGWSSGAHVELVGVVGQRDSTGTGTSGYRVQPRDPADIVALGQATPTPDPSASVTPTPEPDPTGSPPAGGTVTIAEARSLPRHASARIRGIVTLAPGLVDPVSGVLQDGSGAIVIRVGDEVGPLARGDVVEVAGVRSTLAGMETLRVTSPAVRIGRGDEPAAVSMRTGDAGEGLEARLVRVRGSIVATARRAGSGSVSFEVDDGSGPVRVFLAAPLRAETAGLVAGAWVEVSGVLGQETTGSQPLRGYRIWPRTTTEVGVTAAPTGEAGAEGSPRTSGGFGSNATAAGESGGASLAEIGAPDLAGLRVGATLVHGPWPELEIAGLLWDGERLVAVGPASEQAVRDLLARARTPLPVELGGLVALGRHAETGIPLVRLGTDPGDVTVRPGPAHAPRAELRGAGAAWVAIIGHLGAAGGELRLESDGAALELLVRCEEREASPRGQVRVTGIGLSAPPRVVLPCGAIRAAPVLARAAVDTRAATAAARLPTPASSTPPADPAPMRGLAAGLLAAGALLVAGAGLFIVRRLRPGPTTGADGDAPEAPEPTEEGSEEPGSPSLTLVRVPQERGSG